MTTVRIPFWPGRWGIPFDEWRPEQKQAIRDVMAATTRYIVVNAPTGFGKTGLAGGLAQVDSTRTTVLTSTLGLQEQYNHSLPFLFDIRGMRNYPCLAADDEFEDLFRAQKRRGQPITCDDGPCRSDVPCTLKKSGCSYYDRYRQFLVERTGVTSYDKWLSSRRYSTGLGNSPRLICDEGHAVAEHLMSACRIDLPRHEYDGKSRTPRTVNGWKLWAERRLQWMGVVEDQSRVRHRNHHALQRLKDLTQMDQHWAWEATDKGWAFEPTRPSLLLPLLCDEIQQQVVLMSATITPALLHVLGIPEDQITYLDYGSTFPVEQRPVYMLDGPDVPRVDYRMSEQSAIDWLDVIDRIIRRRQWWNGIIHTVSYSRAQQIHEHSQFRHLMITRQPGESTLHFVERFKQRGRRQPTICLHPAIETGFDFPDAQARYQIICKVPFVSTRSPIMRARVEHNPEYRNQSAMQRIVQATGRIVRSEQDWGETFIVDRHFNDWFYRAAQCYAPQWFQDAVQRVPLVPKPLAMAA